MMVQETGNELRYTPLEPHFLREHKRGITLRTKTLLPSAIAVSTSAIGNDLDKAVSRAVHCFRMADRSMADCSLRGRGTHRKSIEKLDIRLPAQAYVIRSGPPPPVCIFKSLSSLLVPPPMILLYLLLINKCSWLLFSVCFQLTYLKLAVTPVVVTYPSSLAPTVQTCHRCSARLTHSHQLSKGIQRVKFKPADITGSLPAHRYTVPQMIERSAYSRGEDPSQFVLFHSDSKLGVLKPEHAVFSPSVHPDSSISR